MCVERPSATSASRGEAGGGGFFFNGSLPMPTYNLHKAAFNGTLNQLPLKALTREAFLQPDKKRGETPLHIAASAAGGIGPSRARFDQVVPEAIRNDRAAMLTPDNSGDTPLHVLASGGCLHQASPLILNDRAAMLTPNRYGSTPLHYAAGLLGIFDQVPEVIRRDRAAMLTPSRDGDTPLHVAARCGQLHRVPASIRNDRAAMLTLNKNGETPLNLAAKTGDFAFARDCLRDVASKPATPLPIAAYGAIFDELESSQFPASVAVAEYLRTVSDEFSHETSEGFMEVMMAEIDDLIGCAQGVRERITETGAKQATAENDAPLPSPVRSSKTKGA